MQTAERIGSPSSSQVSLICAALVVARRQRILEDVVAVEADLLRLRDPLQHPQRGSVPGRADQPELEGVLHQSAT